MDYYGRKKDLSKQDYKTITNDKPVFIMFIGLPAAGKSSFAHAEMIQRDIPLDSEPTYVSSDYIRNTMFGGDQDRETTNKVFNIMRKKTVERLKNNYHVIYDATNLSYKDRRGILNSVPKDVYKMAILFNKEFSTCLKHNFYREESEVVPYIAMERMIKRFQYPLHAEGFDEIYIDNSNIGMTIDPLPFSDNEDQMYILTSELVKGNTSSWFKKLSSEYQHKQLIMDLNQYFNIPFYKFHNTPQDNPNHTFSISRHMYEAWKYIVDNTNASEQSGEQGKSDIESLAVAALFHDIGKGLTKGFTDYKGNETRYAHYYNHENVSAYIAMNFCEFINHELGEKVFDTDLIVKLVQFHMHLYDYKNGGKKWRKLFGEEHMDLLKLLNEADMSAK